MKCILRRDQVAKYVAELALLWKILGTFGSMLVNMAEPQAPNIDPVLPKQQGLVDLAERGQQS